jgi:hypothetical protein
VNYELRDLPGKGCFGILTQRTMKKAKGNLPQRGQLEAAPQGFTEEGNSQLTGTWSTPCHPVYPVVSLLLILSRWIG